MDREDLRRKVDLAFLSAFYGGMLTEKQRRILSLHCEEDLSLGEIAEEVGISRQAVHEALTRAAAKLAEWESALGMAARFRANGSQVWEIVRTCVIPVILLLLATSSLVGDSYNPFIYFQF